MDYVLAFLMGLNESFSQVRSQILLIDPLAAINKVFSMVIQEERQRQLGAQSAPVYPSDGVAFSVKGEFTKPSLDAVKSDHKRFPQFPKSYPDAVKSDHNLFSSNNPRFNPRYHQKERPFCSTCNINGHTVDNCYKIHGYPPGFKFKPRPPPQSAPINHVSYPQSGSENHVPLDTATNNSSADFFHRLDKGQYSRLMAMFANHLSISNPPSDPLGPSHSTGTCFSIYVPHLLYPLHIG